MAEIASIVAAIRQRREDAAQQAAMMLELVPSAETSQKRSFLSMASHFLNDPTVAGRWIDLAIAEEDTILFEEMVFRVSFLDFRQIPDLSKYVALLQRAIGQDRTRLTALNRLGEIVISNPEVVDILIQTYDQQKSASARREILLSLSRYTNTPPKLRDFFLKVIHAVDQDIKWLLVDRLLRKDAVPAEILEKWLTPSEPSEIKHRVLNYLLDRSIPMEAALLVLLEKEPDVACRSLTILTLAAQREKSPKVIQALLGTARHDPDARVRAAAMDAFDHSIEVTPELISEFLTILKTEKSRDVVFRLLYILKPYLSRSAELRDGLVGLLQENLHTDVAAIVVDVLGRLMMWDDSLFETMIQTYERLKDDRVRAVLLDLLSQWRDADERLIKIYVAAVQAPDKRLKTWAVQGLLLLPLTEANTTAVEAGAARLLDGDVPLNMRLMLAEKLASIPRLSTETAAHLKQTAEQTSAGQLKQVCLRKLTQATVADTSTDAISAVDWDGWFHRASIDHSTSGIFPTIYAAYASNPEMAKKILKTVLFDKLCWNSAYQNNIRSEAILSFLMSQNAVDDDVSRYCIERLLEKENGQGSNQHLAALKSNVAFSDLKNSLWLLFGARFFSSMNKVLLRDVLRRAYGSDAAMDQAMRQTLFAQTSPEGVKPFVAFLKDNGLWGPSEGILRDLLARPALLNENLKKDVIDILDDLGCKPISQEEPPPAGPGLADE